MVQVVYHCTVMTLDVTFASSAPSSSVPTISHHFHVGREVGDLILSLFLVGFMFGPIFWGPGSELIGRRPIFIGTLTILSRAFCPVSFLSPHSPTAPASLPEMWDPVNRGITTGVFASSVFLGPVLGPIVGSL
ncbi:major facilitator superfamily domain-containing protein [Russula earlei]|uniref:Major facilitator superfamily domain-containing protein n=1 Tax=Russula earlei TaxID=71964 RepID=A0ACC0TYY1_9AGAM|nr:major facilitator superfamily domain-containing protein [Russula earlei]